MASALAKVLRGGRSGASSRLLLPAMGRRVLQEGVLPHLESSPAVGRLMHTGLWRQSVSASTKPEQQKLVKMHQFSSKRTYMDGSPFPRPEELPWGMLIAISLVPLAIAAPPTVQRFWTRMTKEEE